MITKNNILIATHQGLTIYKRVLSYYYEDALHLGFSGRRSLPAQNPFNGGKESLLVIRKDEIFCFEDTELPEFKGDPFDFAALHYQLSGDELLEKINRDLKLHLEEEDGEKMRKGEGEKVRKGEDERGREGEDEKGRKGEVYVPVLVIDMPQFSFYNCPITNTKPSKYMTLLEVYYLIKSDIYKERTLKLRSIGDPEVASQFKKTQFDSVTFSGVFSKRSNAALVNHSGLLTLDFDHVENLHLVKKTLFNDMDINLMIDMMFDSPSGHGFKCIISIDVWKYTHQQWFETLASYFKKSYNLEVDKSGKDVARACFLPHDPNVWIHPLYRI